MTPETIQTWQNGATGTATVIELGTLPMPATIAAGVFRIVWAKARDPNERVRKTVERYPDKTLQMRLVELKEQTGEFLAEEI
jgi:hypothetical protein